MQLKSFFKKILPKWMRIWIRFSIDLIFLPFGICYLLTLNIARPTRVSRLNTERLGHFVLDVESYLRRKEKTDQDIHILFVTNLPVCNNFLMKKWSEKIQVIDANQNKIFGYMLHVLWKFDLFSFKIDHGDNEYYEWNYLEPVFSFSDDEKKRGEAILEDMGLKQNDWFVCIFARDEAYLDRYPNAKITEKDKKLNSEHDYRNSDIDDLIPSVKYIIDRGGWVIRLGQIVAKRLSFEHPRVVDYPFTKWQSDFMDIYLQYRAKFVLSSTTSGCTDVVTLFNTPYCGVNIPFYFNVPYKDTIFIPKKMIKNNAFFSLREQIDLANSVSEGKIPPNYPDFYKGSFYTQHGISFICNTPDEILDLVKEMFERLDGVFYQTEDERSEQEEYLHIYKDFHCFSNNKNPIGRAFLKENSAWFLKE